MEGLSIGYVSRESGVKIPTIRYYEKIGLLPVPGRQASNRRVYGNQDVRCLKFIRHARELGFEIDDIRALLDLAAEPKAPCEEVDGIAKRHLAHVERRIDQLVALREELRRMVDACGHGRVAECRVIETLADHAQCLTEHH